MNKTFLQFLKYVFYGVIAALINTLLYAFFTRIFNFSTVLSTGIAWILANIFAFFCNQLFVFPGANKKFSQLIIALFIFLISRLLSGLGDVLTMFFFVDKLTFPDIPVKIISSGFFGFINYLLGKFLIFRKPKDKEELSS